MGIERAPPRRQGVSIRDSVLIQPGRRTAEPPLVDGLRE
jgi:hypothetical protein